MYQNFSSLLFFLLLGGPWVQTHRQIVRYMSKQDYREDSGNLHDAAVFLGYWPSWSHFGKNKEKTILNKVWESVYQNLSLYFFHSVRGSDTKTNSETPKKRVTGIILPACTSSLTNKWPVPFTDMYSTWKKRINDYFWIFLDSFTSPPPVSQYLIYKSATVRS